MRPAKPSEICKQWRRLSLGLRWSLEWILPRKKYFWYYQKNCKKINKKLTGTVDWLSCESYSYSSEILEWMSIYLTHLIYFWCHCRISLNKTWDRCLSPGYWDNVAFKSSNLHLMIFFIRGIWATMRKHMVSEAKFPNEPKQAHNIWNNWCKMLPHSVSLGTPGISKW